MRLLLSRRHILRADDPNADYHYSGTFIAISLSRRLSLFRSNLFFIVHYLVIVLLISRGGFPRLGNSDSPEI